ncbi:hypothetical protein AB0H58_05225 [Nocardia neocaledoniensis]|uniref:hypothetical protein n=1 Tax=Nocardia neocaledoniensis TaxID=236511 RepID=UPI0034033CBD
MNKLAGTSALALLLLAPAVTATTAHADVPVGASGSSSLDVLCSPVGGLLVLAGSAENPYGPLLSVVCVTR